MIENTWHAGQKSRCGLASTSFMNLWHLPQRENGFPASDRVVNEAEKQIKKRERFLKLTLKESVDKRDVLDEIDEFESEHLESVVLHSQVVRLSLGD